MGELRGEHPQQREELGTGLEVVTHRALGSGMKPGWLVWRGEVESHAGLQATVSI